MVRASRTPSQGSRKVFVLGIDGAPFSLVHSWACEGKLPTFKKLIEGGAYGLLRSAIPPLSVPAWPCLLTGKNPGSLGIFQFVERHPESYTLKPVRLRWDEWNPAWRLIGARNKRVVMVNVPTVSASESVANGVFVSGPIMHLGKGKLAHPAELNEFLLKQGYEVEARSLPLGDENYLQRSFDLMTQRHRVMMKLLREEPWDFFMGAFYRPDPVKHRFWKYMDVDHPKYTESESSDVILKCYQELDRFLSDFLGCLADDTYVAVVSDHGHGPLNEQVDLNAWLHREGFLTLASRRTVAVNRRALARRLGVFQSDLSAFATWLASFPGLSKVVDGLKRRIPAEPRQAEHVDWANTKAYSFGTGVIFLNLKGREPVGSVDSTEYEQMRDCIIDRLYTFQDTQGTPVVQRVWKREDLYPEADDRRAPDIFIEYAGQSNYVNYNGSVAPGDTLFPTGLHSSGHTRDGLLIVHGPGVKRGEHIGTCQIVDVLPTILHLLNIAPPRGLDGQVVRQVFEHPVDLADTQFQRVDAGSGSAGQYSHQDEEEIMDRLTDLGYLG